LQDIAVLVLYDPSAKKVLPEEVTHPLQTRFEPLLAIRRHKNLVSGPKYVGPDLHFDQK